MRGAEALRLDAAWASMAACSTSILDVLRASLSTCRSMISENMCSRVGAEVGSMFPRLGTADIGSVGMIRADKDQRAAQARRAVPVRSPGDARAKACESSESSRQHGVRAAPQLQVTESKNNTYPIRERRPWRLAQTCSLT